MSRRTIFCVQQEKDEPTDTYCKKFEASTSMTELGKCTATMNMEINRKHTGGDENDVTKRFQAMRLLMFD